MPETPQHSEEAHAERRQSRRRIAGFVGVFVSTMLILLTAYRYAIDTPANDWYLFHVARDTSWVLGKIGHRSELEKRSLHDLARQRFQHELTPQYLRATLAAWRAGRDEATPAEIAAASNEPFSSELEKQSLHEFASQRSLHEFTPQSVRAALAAWRAGRDAATPEEIASASNEPLSAWERWAYRSRDNRRRDGEYVKDQQARRTEPGGGDKRRREGSAVIGPSVYFLLRPGLSSDIDDLRGQIDTIAEDPALDSAEKDRQKVAVQKRIDELSAEQQAGLRGENPPGPDKTRAFSFIVVAECGAIEVMAIFLAAVLAFPAPWWKRLVGIAGGLPLMYGVNIFRLSVLGVIGALDQSRDGKWFRFAHEYVWQAVYIVFVVAVWMAWVEYIVRRKPEE